MSFFYIFIFFLSALTHAQVLQEGGYQILSEKKVVGFLVQRYELDKETKTLKHIYYLQRSTPNGPIKESLVAESHQDFRPLEYIFTSFSDTQSKTIEAQFTSEVMTVTLTENQKKTSLQKRIPKGAFLSSFLIYLIIQNKPTIKSSYHYRAILEKEASLFTGEVTLMNILESQSPLSKGGTGFKVLNTFQGKKEIQYIRASGVLFKREFAGLSIERAQSIIDIMTPMNPPLHQLNRLFSGNLPKGTNVLESPVKKNPFLSKEEILKRNKLPHGVSPPPGKETDQKH